MTGLDEMLARTAGPVASWPLELDHRVTEDGDHRGGELAQAHLICGRCRQSVWCLSKDLDAGVGVFTLGQLGAAVTRHFREVHTDGGGSPV